MVYPRLVFRSAVLGTMTIAEAAANWQYPSLGLPTPILIRTVVEAELLCCELESEALMASTLTLAWTNFLRSINHLATQPVAPAL
jgi:hypothetical protein